MVGSHSIDIDYIHINILFVYVEHIILDSVLPNEQYDNQTKKNQRLLNSINSFRFKMILFFNALYSTIIVTKKNRLFLYL